jgi:hypothetical protein
MPELRTDKFVALIKAGELLQTAFLQSARGAQVERCDSVSKGKTTRKRNCVGKACYDVGGPLVNFRVLERAVADDLSDGLRRGMRV